MSKRRYDYDGFGHFTPSQPIQTDQGIKSKSKRGEFVKNWWATQWIKALERLLDPGRLRRGRTYARQGQVLSIQESKGKIAAKVQGSRTTPYKVSIALTPLNDAQWEKVIDAMAGQAIFAAQLLAGEMPQEIEQAFETAGVSLFPRKAGELITDCSCPDWSNPCKHVAAVHFILGERFDEDPFMIFRLRGRTQEQILEALRARRGGGDDLLEEEDEAGLAIPLAEQIDRFWEMGGSLVHFQTQIKPPVTPLPTLRRLGQPAFLQDDLLRLLGPAYEAMTEAALKTAFGDESELQEDPAE